MKKLISLLLCLFCVDALAYSVSLVWDANSEPDLAGYRLYYGTSSRSYNITNDVRNVTTTTVSNLVAGVTYYFAVTAYNTSDMESDYSNEVSYQVPLPTAPVGVVFSYSRATKLFTIAWTPNPTNQNIVKYNVYETTVSPRVLVATVPATGRLQYSAYPVVGLHKFAVTAVNSEGTESTASVEVSYIGVDKPKNVIIKE